MVRRAPERCVEGAGEQLGDVAEGVVEGEQRVGHRRLVGHVGPAVAVRAHRRPSGEERPDGAVVIRERVVQPAALGEEALAPVGRHLRGAQMVDLRLGAVVGERAPPERHRRQHRVLVDEARVLHLVHARLAALAVRPRLRLSPLLVGALAREAVEPAPRDPVRRLRRGPRALRPRSGLGREGRVARRLRHLGQAAARLDPRALHVDLFVRRVQGAALHPAVSELRVLHEAVAVRVRGGREAPRLDDGLPCLAYVGEVAGGAEAVGMGDDVERGGVGAVPGVRVVREPWDEGGALGDLVGDFSVGALELPQEVEGRPARREVAFGVQRERGPQRVAAEEPREAGPLALAGGAEAGEQPGAERRVRRQSLVDPHLRPCEGRVQPFVRRRYLRRPLLQHMVVGHVPSVESGHRAEEALVIGLGLLLSLHAPDEQDRDEVRRHALARHVDYEAQGDVARLLLIRHDRRVARAGGADQGHEPLGLLGDRVHMRLLVPAYVPRHEAGRPHQLQPGPERAGDGHGQRAVHLQEHHGRGLVEGREQHLAHRERRVRVRERGGLGPDLHPGHDVRPLDVERIALETEGEPEIVDQLQRIDPGLQPARLVAEERRAPPHHVEESAGPDRALELEPALRHGEARQGRRRGRLGRHQRRGDQQEEDAHRRRGAFRARAEHRARD